MAFLMDHRHSSSGSDQSYHSATAEEDHWVHSKNIGAEGFGVVKVFVNHAGSHDLYELSLMMYYINNLLRPGKVDSQFIVPTRMLFWEILFYIVSRSHLVLQATLFAERGRVWSRSDHRVGPTAET